MNLVTDITSGLVVVGVAVVAETSTDPVTHYAGLVEKFGVMAVLLLYFLMRDYFRNKSDLEEKKAIVTKHDELEKFIREKLVEQLDDSTVAIKSVNKTHTKLLTALEAKTPCLAHAATVAKERVKAQSDSDTQT